MLDVHGGEARVGERPPVRVLACGPEGLVAAGVGAWTSPDGASWREVAAGLGRSFSSVAFAAGRAWVASESGLAVLDASDEANEMSVVESEPAPRRPRVVEERRAPAWAGLLPRVAIAFDGWTESAGVAGWRVWVLATVTLGRRWQRTTTTETLEDLR